MDERYKPAKTWPQQSVVPPHGCRASGETEPRAVQPVLTINLEIPLAFRLIEIVKIHMRFCDDKEPCERLLGQLKTQVCSRTTEHTAAG